MTDVPHDTPQAAVERGLTPWLALENYGPHHAPGLADDVLAALSAAGYRVIRTDQLEHGDELVRASDEVEAGVASPRFALRRVVGNEQDIPQPPPWTDRTHLDPEERS